MDKDIALAIQKEEEYLNRKLSGDGTANIYEYLIEAGYDDIDEYHNDAAEYYLKSQNLIVEYLHISKENLTNWSNSVMDVNPSFKCSETMENSLNTIAIVGSDFTEYDKFNETDIYPIKFNYTRGCIITGIDDFNFSITIPKLIWLSLNDLILKKLKKFIETKNENVEINENDILINGKKVVGCATINNNDMCSIVCHISLVDYSDIILEICPPRNDKKKPGYISNITKKEFEEEIQSWLQEQ